MELNILNECAYECTRQSRWKETTQRYLSNMLINNVELRDEVLEGRYAVHPTIDFKLNERGRIRDIEAPVVRDRIVQKVLTKYVLTPSIRPYLIYDNYASLKQRGTTFARKRFEMMLKRYYRESGADGYVLLIDIKKYFENVDHETLKTLIAPRIANESEDIKRLIDYVIDTSSHSEKGLNLGSEAPQIFAVYYLNPIDQFVKVVKGVKYYGRYMDDIFVIGKSKKILQELLSDIKEKLSELKLEINKKKTHIVKLSRGFTFLQVKYNVLKTGKILKRLSHGKIVRERRRLKAFRRMYDKGEMSENDIWNCYQSWRGTIVSEHNAYHKTLRCFDELYEKLFPKHEPYVCKGRDCIVKEINRAAEPEDLHHLFNLI